MTTKIKQTAPWTDLDYTWQTHMDEKRNALSLARIEHRPTAPIYKTMRDLTKFKLEMELS